MEKFDVQISLLEKDDAETLDGLCDLQDAFTAESGTYREMKVNRDKFRETINQYAHDRAFCVVAKIDGRVVGYSPAYLDTQFHDEINFEISTFYVHPDYRNGGIGGMIIDRLCELMEEHKFKFSQIGICAEIQDDGVLQRATELLFKRKGFYQIGTIYGKRGK